MVKAILPSPVGPILLHGDTERLISVTILSGDAPVGIAAPVAGSLLDEAGRQLAAYFARQRDDFDLPLAPAATSRGQALRQAIVAIPISETLSYGALARLADSAPRAIGQACARNPFPVIVPCHRVVGSGGQIGHYSGGHGIITKTWLLDHERRGGLL